MIKKKAKIGGKILQIYIVRKTTGLKEKYREKRQLKPLLVKGLKNYWTKRDRLNLYWIQPEFVLIFDRQESVE